MNDFNNLLLSKTDLNATQDFLNRRVFLRNGAAALSATALAGLLPQQAQAGPGQTFPNFPAKAKRVIYLFQSGAPSQMDLFDPKPLMEKQRGKDLQTLRAVGLVVNVATPDALAALRRLAPGVMLSPASGDDLAQRLGLKHYPVLITATGIEP